MPSLRKNNARRGAVRGAGMPWRPRPGNGVQLGEQLAEHTVGDGRVAAAVALGGQGVDLVLSEGGPRTLNEGFVTARVASAPGPTIKTMDGAAARAFRNTSRTARSESPTHLLNSSGPLTAIKLRPPSVARAVRAVPTCRSCPT